MNIQNILFAKLFKKFRLTAGFESLSSLGDVLADQNNIFDDSTLSRWQNGSRIPKSRDILIKLIKIFADNNGITHLEEANSFMESANQGFLTNKESQSISKNNLLSSSPFQAPRLPTCFTGRKSYLRSIRETVLRGRTALIYGSAGNGKTMLAVNIAHSVKGSFPDGVLWVNLSAVSPERILGHIAETYGENIWKVSNPNRRAVFVNSLLSKKRALIVFDNLTSYKQLNLLLPNTGSSSVIITSRQKIKNLTLVNSIIDLKPFRLEESLALFKKILKKRYEKTDRQQLTQLANLLGNLPLAVSIIASQLTRSHNSVQSFIKKIKEKNLEFADFIYENKNLHSAILLSFKNLTNDEQKVFISLGAFGGENFSLKAVSYINKISLSSTEKLIASLVDGSLVYYHSNKRYRLHPMIKLFIHQYLKVNKSLYSRLIPFYIDLLKQHSKSLKSYKKLKSEVNNILILMEKTVKTDLLDSTYKLWTVFDSFLWNMGYWHDFHSISKSLYEKTLTTENGHIKCHLCNNLSLSSYWTGNLSEAEKAANEYFILASKQNNKEMMAKAKDRLGKLYQSKKLFNKAITVLKSAIKLSKKATNYELTGNIYRHICEVYMLKNDFINAKKYMIKAFHQYEKIKNPALKLQYVAFAKSHFAIISLNTNCVEKAEKLFKKSLRIEEKTGGKSGTKIATCMGLALIYEGKNIPKKAIKYFEIAAKEIELMGIANIMDKLHVFSSVMKTNLNKSNAYKKVFTG